MPAKGSAEWKGDVPTGTGTFSAGDTITGWIYLQVPFRGRARVQPRAVDRGCTRSLLLDGPLQPSRHFGPSTGLGAHRRHGHPETRRRCPRRSRRSTLVTVGRVPGIDQATFVEKALAAKTGCPVSRALAGVPEITLDASLAG